MRVRGEFEFVRIRTCIPRLVPTTAPTTKESLAGVLVLSSQSRLLRSNPLMWLCDKRPVESFRKGPPPQKVKLKRWWTYLSEFRLTVHHIPNSKNEPCDYISRNNFDQLTAERSEALAKDAFQRIDVQLDLSMRTGGILEGWSLTDYQSEYENILQTLTTGLEPRVIDGHQWCKNNQYLFHLPQYVQMGGRKMLLAFQGEPCMRTVSNENQGLNAPNGC